MKKNCAIVFGITKNLDFALANVLIGLKKHNNKFWDDIIVYHDGLSEETIKYLNKITKIEAILYDSEKIKSKIDEELIKNYSILTLSRFECFDLLKKYKKIMWHDVDILIQGNIEDLLHYSDKTGIAMTIGEGFLNEQNFYGLMEGYELLRPLYNAGIFVISEKLKKYEELTTASYNLFNQYAPKLRYLDQSVLNMIIEDFNLNVEEIPLEVYCCHPKNKLYKEAKIIHAYGIQKFWNSFELKKQFPEWNENNIEWENITNKESYKLSPAISVIMSVFDRTDFLKESIESILNQTFKDFEFIIVLEYSTKQKEIEEFIEKFNDERIVIIKNKEKLGFAESLNVAIKNSKGKYIARMDDDDISLPNRFEVQYNYLETNKDVDIIGSYMKMFMRCDDFCPIPCNYDDLKLRALTTTPLYHPTVMMRKQTILNNDYFYDKKYLTEDYELWCRIINDIKIENIPMVLLHYRASNQNATITKTIEVQKCHDDIVKRNFKENLKLNFNDDEIKLLQYEDLLNHTFNSNELRKLRNECIKKIIRANRIYNKYDEWKLCEFFNNWDYYITKRNISHTIKKIVKKIFYPFYYLLKRIYNKLSLNEREMLVNLNNKLDNLAHKIEENNNINEIIDIKSNIESFKEVLDLLQYENNLNNIQRKLNLNLSNIFNNNIENSYKNKKAVFLNDTFDDYHHGSTTTSFIIRENLQNKFKEVESIPISNLRNLVKNIINLEDFDDDKFYKNFEKENNNLLSILKSADYIVVNGEGCLSNYNNDSTTLLYLMYISKIKFKKNVALINTSILTENTIDLINENQKECYEQLLKKTLSKLDYIATREIFSYMTARNIIENEIYLSFDNLPIYVRNYYTFQKTNLKEKYIVVSSGNNFNNKTVDSLIETIEEAKKQFNCDKIKFLYSKVKTAKIENDIKLYNKLKETFANIELIEAKDINEWLDCIYNSELLISGRYHHTIAAISLNKKFVVYESNTSKIYSILFMLNKIGNILSLDKTYNKKVISYAKNQKNTNKDLDIIYNLAKNNFKF